MKIRIRTKLAAALALPLGALVAVSGFEAYEASEDADRVREETELATVSIGPSSLTTELQNERNYTALDLIGLAEAATLEVSSVAEARERVDAAIGDLRAFVEGRDPLVREEFGQAFELLDAELEATRELWDDYDGDKDLENQELADEVFAGFTAMTEAFFGATGSVATAVDESSLRNGIEIVDQSNRRGELLASVTRIIVLDTLTKGNEARFRADAAVGIDRIRAHERRIEQLSVGPYADVDDETLDRDFDQETDRHFSSYLMGEDVDLSALLASVSAGGADGVTSSAEMASSILDEQASVLTTEADERKEQFALLAAGVVALALIASWAASRSITRPLRKLRAEADAMASERLPTAVQQILDTPLGEDVEVPDLQPIVVKTRDEVREVVAVLNDVQERTLALAADQAVLRRNIADSFVNLGRRNQNLLDRQLEFITELEQGETEPEELESLFRLDHLATRMRRNAESLLVLAGVESPRQWSAPVSIDDVLRAALGEVEGYQRVAIRNLEPAMVSGTAASSISHVVAELIENALNFSPPEEMVEVKGRANGDGYVIAVDDNGIGMDRDDLEAANRRLSGEESYTVAPSRYLGHYVAGNLADRYDIAVRLQDSPAGGVTATVSLPDSVLEDGTNEYVPAHLAPDPAGEQETPGEQHGDGPEVVEHDAIAPPQTLSEAIGRLELQEIESADDLIAATEGGLPRRVPGAQRPDLSPTIARREPRPEPALRETAAPTGGAFGFLTAFSQAATAPAATDGTTTDPTEPPDQAATDLAPEDR